MSEDIAAPTHVDTPAPTSPVAPAPTVAEIAAPAVAVPAVEPAPIAPVVVETPAVEARTEPVAAPAEPVATEAKPEAEAAKPPERAKTLLEKADEATAAAEAAAKAEKDGKKDDKKAAEDAKPGDEKAKPEEAEKPLEGEILPLDFEIPKQLKADPEQIAKFSDLLRSTKSGDLKDAGQKLLDMHGEALDSFAKQYAQEYSDNAWKVWNNTVAAKEKEILADPIVGGAGHETAKAAVVRMRDLGVPESDRAAFSEMLNVTGVGSWPPFWRMLHRFAEIFDEPPMPLPGGKPPKDAHIQQPAGRFGLLHDHPTSQAKRD